MPYYIGDRRRDPDLENYPFLVSCRCVALVLGGGGGRVGFRVFRAFRLWAWASPVACWGVGRHLPPSPNLERFLT